MSRLFILIVTAGLAAAPAFAADRHPGGGGGHPAAAHRTVSHAAHFSAHRPAMHRAMHRSAHQVSRHRSSHVSHHVAHHVAHHAIHHAVHHAIHRAAATAHRANHFAKVRRSVRAMRRFHAGVYRRPRGWYAHHWVIGERLPRAWFARNYWLSDWAIYGLWAPVDGLIWVRVGPDAMLVDPATGAVVGVEYGLFF
jgi:Ni/Co efflux regulator RcnB